MYDEYEITLQVRDRICGGIPKDPAVIEAWLRGQGVLPKEANERVRTIKAELGEDKFVEQEADKSWTTFKRDPSGVYIEPRQIRALIKESAFILEMTKTVKGLRQRLQHGMAITPDRIFLTRDGNPILEPDAYEERPIHVIGPQGPRTGLKRFDYISGPTLSFSVRIVKPDGKEKTEYITEERLRKIFEWAQDGIGLGASRSQDEGKFDVVKFEKVK